MAIGLVWALRATSETSPCPEVELVCFDFLGNQVNNITLAYNEDDTRRYASQIPILARNNVLLVGGRRNIHVFIDGDEYTYDLGAVSDYQYGIQYLHFANGTYYAVLQRSYSSVWEAYYSTDAVTWTAITSGLEKLGTVVYNSDEDKYYSIYYHSDGEVTTGTIFTANTPGTNFSTQINGGEAGEFFDGPFYYDGYMYVQMGSADWRWGNNFITFARLSESGGLETLNTVSFNEVAFYSGSFYVENEELFFALSGKNLIYKYNPALSEFVLDTPTNSFFSYFDQTIAHITTIDYVRVASVADGFTIIIPGALINVPDGTYPWIRVSIRDGGYSTEAIEQTKTRLYAARVTAGSSELELLCFDMSGNLLNTKYITLEEPVIAAYSPIRSRTLYVSDDESLFLFYAQDLHSSDKTYAYILKDANQYSYLLENYITMLYDEFCLVDDVIFRTHYDESKITATYTVDGETWFNLGEETSGYYSITTNTFATYSEELEKYFYLNARWTGLEGQIFSGYLNCNSTYDFFPISGVDCSIPDISLYNTFFAPKELICRDGKVYAYVQYFFNSMSGGGIFAADGVSTNLITAGSGYTFNGEPTFYFDTFSLYVNTNGNISAIGKDKDDSPSGFWSWEIVNDELVRTEQLSSLIYRRLSYSKTGYAKEGTNYYFVEVDFNHVWSLHTPTSTITLPTRTDQYYVGAYFINGTGIPPVPAFWTEKVKCVETIYEYGT